VLKDLPDVVIPDSKDVPLPMPSSDLHRHLGELLQGQRGPALKNILDARSPVFMAEFFGHMNEGRSQPVQIEDMQAVVLKAMLHFIYTDTAPELDEEPEAAATMAQHLLAAADRYDFFFQNGYSEFHCNFTTSALEVRTPTNEI
jgi:speckle-type POZ protein